MNNMKRTLLFSAACAVIAVCSASCTKDTPPPVNETAELKAVLPDEMPSVWESGSKLAIFNDNGVAGIDVLNGSGSNTLEECVCLFTNCDSYFGELTLKTCLVLIGISNCVYVERMNVQTCGLCCTNKIACCLMTH